MMSTKNELNRRDFFRTTFAGAAAALAQQLPELAEAQDEPKEKPPTGRNSMNIAAIIQISPDGSRQMKLDRQAQKPLMDLLANDERLANTRISKIASDASALSSSALRRGDELVFGDILEAKLKGYKPQDPIPPKVALSEVKQPTLHLLTAITDRFPGYLDSLTETQTLELTWGLARYVADEQVKLNQRPIVKEGSNMLSLLYEDSAFTPEPLKLIGQRFKLNMVGLHGGSETDPTQDTKARYLTDLSKMALDRSKLGLVWNFTHSNSTHIVLRDFQQAGGFTTVDESDLISGRELAKAMVDAQVRAIESAKKTGKKIGEQIDLSHLTFFLEGCLQGGFAQDRLNSEIFRQADASKFTVAGLPMIAAASQRGMLANDFSQLGDGGQLHQSKFQLAVLRERIPEGDPFCVHNLLSIDRGVREAYKVLHMLEITPTRQDMIVYSPKVINLDDLTQGMVDELKLPKLPQERMPLTEGRQHSIDIALGPGSRRALV